MWVRGDGAHYTSEGSLWVARWLMPQLGVAALETPNNTLPVMKMVGLANGAVVKGKRALVTVAAYQFGVAKVEFQITGGGHPSSVIGPAATAQGFWALYWHTKDVPNGIYVVRSIAYNAEGNRSISRGITVRVAN